MDDCPTYETLLEYCEGHAETSQIALVSAHLEAGCPTCRHQMAFLKRALHALEAAYRSQAPIRAQNAARLLFRTRPPRTLIARLRQGAQRTAMLAFARGEEKAGIQWLYFTGNHDIDIWDEEQDDHSRYLIGQALLRDDGSAITPDDATLHLTDGSILPANFVASEFHFAKVPVGLCQLHLLLGDCKIVIPEISVGGGRE